MQLHIVDLRIASRDLFGRLNGAGAEENSTENDCGSQGANFTAGGLELSASRSREAGDAVRVKSGFSHDVEYLHRVANSRAFSCDRWPMNLPPLIQKYIDASNAHDVKSILGCFADDATVRDENATHRGKIDIERWVTTTIEKYKFQFKPLRSQELATETIVSVEVSGTFPGSPVTLDYHFTLANGKIATLMID